MIRTAVNPSAIFRCVSAPTGLIALVIMVFVCTQRGLADGEKASDKTTYDDNVKSVFNQRCFSCHNPNKKSGDLDLTNYTNLIQGGASGAVIEPGDVEGSYLYSLITHEDEPVMPPDGKIPQAEIDLLRKWIEGGALENRGSKAVIKKPTGIAMTDNPLERPAVVSVPPRLIKQPVVHTAKPPVVKSIATSPWAPLAAVAGQQQVLLYNTQTLELVGVLPFPEGTVNVVRFSRTGQVLLAAGGRHGASGKAVLWNVATGERLTEIGDEMDAILAADISADQTLVAVGGPSRLIRIYSTETGELKREIKKHTDWVTAIEFSTDGVLLATGDRNGGLHVWEAFTGREYLTLKGHSAAINSISWRGDSNVLASGSKDTTVRIWEMENGSQIRSIAAHGGGATSLEFTRDGRILSTGRDRVTKLWGQDGKQQKAFPALGEIALSTSWCDETARAIAGDFNGQLVVWESNEAKQMAAWTPNPPPIENQLAAAKKQYQEKLSRLEPAKVQFAQVSTQVEQIQQQLGAAQANKSTAEQAVNELQTQIKTASVKKTESDQARNQLADKLKQAQEAKPLVAEALRNLTEAAGKLAGNQSLQQQVDVLAEQVKQLDIDIAGFTTELNSIQSKMTESSSQIQAASGKMKQAQQGLQTATQKVTEVEATLKPLVEQKLAAQTAVTNLEAEIQAAKQNSDRWQSEIEFVAQLNQLNQQLQAAKSVVQQRQQSLDDAQAQLSQAQIAVNAAQQSTGKAQSDLEAIVKQINQAKGIDK